MIRLAAVVFVIAVFIGLVGFSQISCYSHGGHYSYMWKRCVLP